jgi:diketogulonate reductase-like aldo/keto reductase
VDIKRDWGVPSEKDHVVIDALCAVADEVGATPAARALAWVLSRPGVASTIVGARQLDQLEANLAALDLNLTDAQVTKLDAVSKPALNFPGEINTHLAPPVGFPGVTVDGRTWPLSRQLAASTNRY